MQERVVADTAYLHATDLLLLQVFLCADGNGVGRADDGLNIIFQQLRDQVEAALIGQFAQRNVRCQAMLFTKSPKGRAAALAGGGVLRRNTDKANLRMFCASSFCISNCTAPASS